MRSCPTHLQAVWRYLSERYGLREFPHPLERLEATVAGLQPGTPEFRAVEGALIAASTNGETHFLRHRGHFEWLAREWVPRVREECRAVRSVRILCAGCSTGEEAYSLVATLLPLLPGWRVSVVAVDVNEQALEVARRGRYGPWSLRGFSPECHDWLSVRAGEVTVAAGLRHHLSFQVHNLLEPFGVQSRFDLIVCRNVMIYFTPQAVKRTWANLAAALAERGLLLCGPSDPGPPEDVGLQQHWYEQVRAYSRCETSRAQDGPTFVSVVRRSSPTPRPEPSRKEPAARPVAADAIFETVQTLLHQGQITLAGDMLEAATRDHPLHLGLIVLDSMVAAERGELNRAVTASRRATFLAPQAPYPVFLLGTMLEKTADLVGAERRYRWCRGLLAEMEGGQVLAFSGGLSAGQLREVLDARESA